MKLGDKPKKQLGEVADAIAGLFEVENGAVYRDSRTGWVGVAMKPEDVMKTPLGRDGRPKVPLRGASGKGDRVDEIRYAFLDDLERLGEGVEPVGFGAVEGSD